MVVPQIFPHLSRQHLDFGVNLKICISQITIAEKNKSDSNFKLQHQFIKDESAWP